MDQSARYVVRIDRKPSEVFAWHENPGAFERLTPPWMRVEVTERSGGIRDGAVVKLRSKVGGRWSAWEVEHRDYVEGVQFRDVQRSGPFARWEHLHRVAPDADNELASQLADEIAYRLPFGALGQLAGGWYAKRQLDRLFRYRHAITRADNEVAASHISVRPLRVLIAGASGLVGSALIPFLRTQGHAVTRLVRRAVREADEISWDPAKGVLDSSVMRSTDVVINLSGESVAGGRWSPERKQAILDSRVQSTRTLVNAIAAVQSIRFRPFVFIAGSASGFYGSRGDEALDETSTRGAGFLADVCEAWEAEAAKAEPLDVRVVRLRTGVVLTPAGGALAKLLPVFRLGAGGPLGRGKRWMSWISIDDLVGAIYHAILDRRCDGPVNAVAPHAVTNAEFTSTLARVLRRPALVPAPPAALRAVFGEMADETLLSSARVSPRRLQEALYRFRHPDLESALRHVLGR